MPMSWRVLVVVAALGCGDNGNTQRDAGVCTTPPCEKTVAAYRLLGPPALDVLWVIDNSAAAGPLQDALAANVSNFVNVLDTIGTAASIRMGVISGDLGAGPYDLAGCSGFGDNGQLQYAPRTPTCSPPEGRFIENLVNPDGSRQTNYSGTMTDAFNCIAKLGTTGCPYQQPLEAARRALTGDGVTTGFLRDDAYLMLAFVSVTDDCSASDSSLFDPTNAALGPVSPFRCFEHGVQCNPDAARTAGTKTGCVSREASTLVSPVQSHVDAFKDLKQDPSRVFVSVIGGPTTPVNVDVAAEPSLRASCSSDGITAAPAIRLTDFAKRFVNRETESSACQSDLSGALVQTAQLLRTVQGHPCLPSNVTMPLQCRVEEIRVDGIDDAQLVRELPRCDNDEKPSESTNFPCFDITADEMSCTTPETVPFAIDLYPVTRAPMDNIWAVTKCMVDALP